MKSSFDLTPSERNFLLDQLCTTIAEFYDQHPKNVSPSMEPEIVKKYVSQHSHPETIEELLENVVRGLKEFSVHPTSSGYLGLFNPRSTFMSVIADGLTALYNPQLAAWSHAPYAVEVENWLMKEIGSRFGYHPQHTDGAFTTGGAEANLTAVITALHAAHPEIVQYGLQVLAKPLRIYCSKESHHSIQKAVKVAGLGLHAISLFEVSPDGVVDTEGLRKKIREDQEAGFEPLMMIATAGATSTGIIEPIGALADIAAENGMWLHTDAAYGGICVFTEKYKNLVRGIERSDSITFDAHKGLSVSMSAGMFLTRHPEVLSGAFSIQAAYMPDANKKNEKDPYAKSIQWSRRFIGLKLYMSILAYGWDGYRETIENQFKMSAVLKDLLQQSGWEIYNKSALPIVCFGFKNSENQDQIEALCHAIVDQGNFWISTCFADNKKVLRACITNFNTTTIDIQHFIEVLNKTKEALNLTA